MSINEPLSKRQASPLLRDRIISLKETGRTNADVARELGVSKGVVAGMLYRWAPQLQLVRLPAEPPPKNHDTIPDANGCHFIFGVTLETYRYCGDAAVAGKPYCATHCAIVYIRPKKGEA